VQRRSDLIAPVALTIAGHDPSSGAGISADLQVFSAFRLFGISAITALTAQSTLGVAAVEPVLPGFLGQVLSTLDADLPPDGIKIGILGSAAVASEVAAFLQVKHQATNDKTFIPIVLDPVLVSSSGATLLTPEGRDILRRDLLPLVGWITPNWAELAVLTGLPAGAIGSLGHAEAAMHQLGALHPKLTIVATGGDQARPIDQLRLPDGSVHRFEGERVDTKSTHGTGCAFSSALLCRLLLGDEPVAAVRAAKEYVADAIRRAPGIGHGNGPLNLLWPLG
jgi:hydroxymethylpyrimidine/phosphomethylpyrimidine kinase